MKHKNLKYAMTFLLGMLTLAVGYLLVSVFGGLRRPTPLGTIEDYEAICFRYDDQGSIQASISPKGCYSTSCTRQVSQAGSAVINQDQFHISFKSRFVLAETSRFLLPCTENCAGGGTIHFDLVKGPILVPIESGQITVLLRHTDRVAHHLMPHVAGSRYIPPTNPL
jgi:hypothetical protein